jgi:phosphohistidine swiveling domain-containing protein
VRRGHLERAEPHSLWLKSVHAVFGGSLDLEWAERADGQRILLQARPALFPIRRNETLSLANHKEILGDPPSPWMVGVLAEVGRTVMSYFAAVEPAVAEWDEPYAIELGERAWMNFSVFFRLMDHWGLPRTMVTDGVGGEAHGSHDRDFDMPRLIRKLPTMTRMAIKNLLMVGRIGRGLTALDAALADARDLPQLESVNAQALDFSIRTNFAIVQVLSVLSRFRRALGLRQAGNVVTHRMMEGYTKLASLPTLDERLAGLDHWLARYGHRGPLESDPSQPRFSELRPQLEADLSRGPAPAPAPRPQPNLLVALLGRVFFLSDEWRERFRDRLMRWWQRLRVRLLEAAESACRAGYLERPDDVFLLRREDLASDPALWAERVKIRRARWERAKSWDLPTTASRDEIEAAVRTSGRFISKSDDGLFTGIGLGTEVVCGTAVRGTSVASLLSGAALPETSVLIAETLEPSWAILFPRFAAVVAQLGGELSHAAILLREAGISAVVNARGAFDGIADGDLVQVDPLRGEVTVVTRANPADQTDPGPAFVFNKTS